MRVELWTGKVHVRRESTLARWVTLCGVPFWTSEVDPGRWLGGRGVPTTSPATCRRCAAREGSYPG